MANKEETKALSRYAAELGRKGGRVRAQKYPKAVLREWAKRGGRPPKKGQRHA